MPALPPQHEGGVMSYWIEKAWDYEHTERLDRAASDALAREAVRVRREQRRAERAGRTPSARTAWWHPLRPLRTR